MGLTVSRKTAKNLAVRRKNQKNFNRYKVLTVNRKSHYAIASLLTVIVIDSIG